MQIARRPSEVFEHALTFSRQNYSFTDHKRLPNYCVAGRHLGYSLEDLTGPRILDTRDRFCCFLHRNPVPLREDFVNRLSHYKRVDCPGRSLNNMSYNVPIARTIAFLRQYKFLVCFENELGDGYVTEKIVNAYQAGCVPIYWGDPLVVSDFHPGSMINANCFSDLDQLVAYVAWVDKTPAAYRSIRTCPPLFGNQVPVDFMDAQMVSFWRRVLNESPPTAAFATP
jgi:alpha(1,3/1,4) fucosyltransferase